MSVSAEVRRTLVKSPPELWAELSDPAALARHLGELGEIRIVRTEPERTVDWEATAADGSETSGRVEIEPSGWGTRVTLSASHPIAPSTPAEPAAAEQELEPAPAPPPEPEPAPEPAVEMVAVVPEPEPEPEPEFEPELVQAAEPDPGPERRPGFFARLFRRRNRRPSEPRETVRLEPEPEPPAATVETATPEPAAADVEVAEPNIAAEPDIVAEPDTAPKPDIAAELAELEQQTAAVLTGVLDRLGAAHHRPFSRA